MRENDSDGEGGWAQSPGYVSPWVPRDEDRDEAEDTRARWSGANAVSPAEHGYQDTVAFGTPAGHGSRPDYGQAWYGNQPGHGSQPDYGQRGYQGQAGSGEPASHRAGGGIGGPGWGMPGPPPRPSGRGGRLLVYVAVAALAASIGAGVTVAVGQHGAAQSAGISSGDVPGPHNNASGSGSSSAPLNPAKVQKKVDPGLVDIIATLKYNSETAEGTGMVISSGGLVLTNNHVIDQATAVRVALVTNSNQSYSAKVVGYDATDDVALLQLEGASSLPTESFGNSSQVSLGTPVLALGNADGRGGAKPAQGIINALDRSIQASDEGSNSTENLRHMLQTNARIQQGDSGGALANNAGQVIGMITAANTGTSSQTGSSGGTLGFAIPVNSALTIARQIAAGRASATVSIGLPGFLGVEVATSDSSNPQQQAADEAQSGSGGRAAPRSGSSCQTSNQQTSIPARIAPTGVGALIVGVLCDTAAASARMVPGDVITAVGGTPITTPTSLTSIAAKHHPGDVISVLWVSLNGAEHTTRMLLGQGPAR